MRFLGGENIKILLSRLPGKSVANIMEKEQKGAFL